MIKLTDSAIKYTKLVLRGFLGQKKNHTSMSIQYLRVYWGKQFALQFLELFLFLHFKLIQQEQYIVFGYFTVELWVFWQIY